MNLYRNNSWGRIIIEIALFQFFPIKISNRRTLVETASSFSSYPSLCGSKLTNQSQSYFGDCELVSIFIVSCRVWRRKLVYQCTGDLDIMAISMSSRTLWENKQFKHFNYGLYPSDSTEMKYFSSPENKVTCWNNDKK